MRRPVQIEGRKTVHQKEAHAFYTWCGVYVLTTAIHRGREVPITCKRCLRIAKAWGYKL